MLYKVNAIVLSRLEIGEADNLITLYSEERGKIRAIAKGVRKTRSKFGSSLEPFMLSRLLVYSKKDSTKQTRLPRRAGEDSLDIISDAQIQEAFRNLRGDLTGFAYGNFLAELVSKMTGHGGVDGNKIFHLLKEFLRLWEKPGETKVLIYAFTMRFLDLLGYHPQLVECVKCGSIVEKEKEFGFSINCGGILCTNCREKDVLRISISSLQYLKQLIRMGPGSLKNLRISQYCEKEIERIVQDYLNFYLESNVESLSFLLQAMEVSCHI